jgi:hypothetical protein
MKHAAKRARERYGYGVKVTDVVTKIKAGQGKREYRSHETAWVVRVNLEPGKRVYAVWDGQRVRTFLTEEQVNEDKRKLRAYQKSMSRAMSRAYRR